MICMANILMRGFDVSASNTNVDFKKAKEQGYDFVIIRAGFGRYERQKDTMFEQHYKNATEAGLHVGAYWYSYAQTVTSKGYDPKQEALMEAEVCKKIIAGKKFDMPIWYDLEEKDFFNKGSDVVNTVATTFCNYMEQNGYFCGLYGGEALTNLLPKNTLTRYALWYAQYLKEPRYKGTYGMWQYCVAGDSIGNNPNNIPCPSFTSPKLDMDYCYYDYPTAIKNKKLNGYGDTTPVTPTPTPDPVTGFVPRLTIPEYGNKYYNSTGNGGYAVGCIKGSPQQPGLDILSNCFSGDTKIITRDGIVRLDAIIDKDVLVLSKDGIYRHARGRYFGEQNVYKVTFSNGSEYVCTANHRWYVKRDIKRKSGKLQEYLFKETKDLTSQDYIPYVFIRDSETDVDAIRHGFIYGDGAYYNSYRSSLANLCGKKKDFMMEYFKDSLHISTDKNGTVACYPYPKEYKDVPDVSCDLKYLRGFIKGLIASDGCVDYKGCVKISTVRKKDAEKISEICSVLGYRNKLRIETRDTNYKKNSTLYHVSIMSNCLSEDMFINPEHRLRVSNQNSKKISFTRIKSIESLNRVEDVFCVEEPETHTFALEGNILTGNCVPYSAARFNEIGKYGCWKYLKYPPNAENFIEKAQGEGLTISKEPSLGAIIVWQKGATLNGSDGAGHVAVVEVINADGTIVTSESGYNAKNPFWTTARNNKDGNWNGGSAYKFRGFIVNPAVVKQEPVVVEPTPEPTPDPEPEPTNKCPYPEPTRSLKNGMNGDDVKWMQWYLNEYGMMFKDIDGVFDLKTLAALITFQFKYKLQIDASCGPITRKALKDNLK